MTDTQYVKIPPRELPTIKRVIVLTALVGALLAPIAGIAYVQATPATVETTVSR